MKHYIWFGKYSVIDFSVVRSLCNFRWKFYLFFNVWKLIYSFEGLFIIAQSLRCSRIWITTVSINIHFKNVISKLQIKVQHYVLSIFSDILKSFRFQMEACMILHTNQTMSLLNKIIIGENNKSDYLSNNSSFNIQNHVLFKIESK